MKTHGLAAFAFDHVEKAPLALALFALVYVGARFVLPAPHDGIDVARLNDQVASIERHMKTGRVELPPLPDRVGPLREALQAPPRTRAFPTWLMHRRPHFLTDVPTIAVPEVVHAAPVGLSADGSRRDRIDLVWKAGEGEAHITRKAFVVERSETDPDFKPTPKRPLVWKVLGQGALAWRDETVRPGRAYRYRVVSVAAIDSEDAAVKEHGLTLAPEERRKTTAVIGPFVPKPTVYVRVADGSPNQAEALRFHGGSIDVRRFPKVGSATLRVWVWSPTTGFKQTTLFGVREGEAIRKVSRKTARAGEQPRVVMDTGHTLRRVKLAKIERILGDRAWQVVGVVVEIEGPDGRRWSIVQHQPLPAELARRD